MSNFFLSPEYQRFACRYAANLGKLDSFRVDDPSEDTRSAGEDSEASLDAVKAAYANAWRRDDEAIESAKSAYENAWKGTPKRNIAVTKYDADAFRADSKITTPKRNIAVTRYDGFSRNS